MLNNSQILIVEDNDQLRGILGDFLDMKGASVDFADNGELGLKLALENSFDAIILDVMMPKKDGLQVAQQLRENGRNVPILMLTALNGAQDLLNGFEHGIDDYVTKPFQFPELEARLNALIKRFQGKVANSVLRFGDLKIDQSSRQVSREHQLLPMTPVMYQILLKLIKAAPKAVTRDALIYEIWGDNAPDKDMLRSHIYLLRQALDKPFDKPMLVTVPKFGFKLVQ